MRLIAGFALLSSLAAICRARADQAKEVYPASDARWDKVSGTWDNLQGDFAQATMAGDHVVGLEQREFSDASFQFRCQLKQSAGPEAWAGFAFRKSSPQSTYGEGGYLVYLRANGSLELYNGTVLQAAATHIDPSLPFELKVVANGDRLQVYLNHLALPLIDVSDSAGTGSAVGFETNDATASFGPLLVEPAAPEPAASPAASPGPKWTPVRLALREKRDEENLWIDIAINGGRPIEYLLDTGSDALFAAPPAWQGAVHPSKPVINTKVPEKISYGDNTYGYHFFPVRAQLTFFNANTGVPAFTLPNPSGYVIGRIVDWYSNDWPEKRRAMVREVPTTSGIGGSQSGIFGCRMFIAHGGDDKIGHYDVSNTLLQLPGVGGYVVTDNGPPGTASLTVGLNKAIREQFPQKISLSRGDDTFPDSNLHACDESRVDVTFSHTGSAPVTIHNVILGLDTGSGKDYGVALTAADARVVAPYLLPDNGAREDRSTTTNKPIRPGTTVTFSFPPRPDGFNYSFVCPQYAARWNSGPMIVKSQTAQESDVTAGIGFFEQFAVMYDIENGELGFRKTPPDLSARVLASP